jgi:AcrR family transcriptional regulator
MGASTNKRRQKLTAKRERQILDAALSVFSQKGFFQATTAEIAQAAGVAEGTIYNYYRSKRDLLLSLISSYIEAEHVIGILEHPSEAGDRVLLHSLIKDRINTGFANVDRLLLLMSEIQRDPELRQQYLDKVGKPILERVQEYLESGIERKAFRPLITAVTARALMGMVIGLAILYYMEGETGPLRKIPSSVTANEVHKLFLEGIQVKRGKGG